MELTGLQQGNDGDGPVGRKFPFLKPAGDIAIDEVRKRRDQMKSPWHKKKSAEATQDLKNQK